MGFINSESEMVLLLELINPIFLFFRSVFGLFGLSSLSRSVVPAVPAVPLFLVIHRPKIGFADRSPAYHRNSRQLPLPMSPGQPLLHESNFFVTESVRLDIGS